MKNTLSQQALDMIQAYESLQFGDKQIITPYFNNKRQKVRGALRVLVGKGTPSDIVEEAELMARRTHVDLKKLSKEDITKFLVDHNLGVDCSGFVYHVLNAEKPLKSRLKFPNTFLLRKLLTTLRPVENTNVKVLAHEKNSTDVAISDIQPGDIITMIGSKRVGNPDHVLLVESTENNVITFVNATGLHCFGKYDHGIKHGEIEITDAKKKIQDQRWDDAEVLNAVREAKEVSVKRLNIYPNKKSPLAFI